MREHGQDDLHLVAHALGKERPQRAVGEPGGQDAGQWGPAFAPEHAARNLADGIAALFVIHGEREVIDPLAQPIGHHDGAQNHGVAIGHDDGAIRLLGQAASLEREPTPAKLGLNGMHTGHSSPSVWTKSKEASPQPALRPRFLALPSGPAAFRSEAVYNNEKRSGFGADRSSIRAGTPRLRRRTAYRQEFTRR